MTIRVDDELGPEFPDDGDAAFDFDSEIELIISIEDDAETDVDAEVDLDAEIDLDAEAGADAEVDTEADAEIEDLAADDAESDEDDDDQDEAEDVALEADEAEAPDDTVEINLGDVTDGDAPDQDEAAVDGEETDSTATDDEAAEVVYVVDGETAEAASAEMGDDDVTSDVVDEAQLDAAETAEVETDTTDEVAKELETAPVTAEEQSLMEESATPEVLPAAQPAGGTWSFGRALGVAAPAMAVVVAFGALGYGFGWSRGGEEVVRREFVYTLDESVPDSFLREDRRLLTQIVTIESDSVLAPVADEFDLPIEELRDKIEVETVDLSEVLRLDVSDDSRLQAAAISEAVIEQYLLVSSNPLPTEASTALRTQRDEVVEALATADASLLELQQNRREDAQLETQEESLVRQINLNNEQVNRLQGLLDTDTTLTTSRRTRLETEMAASELELTELETSLASTRTQRATLAEQSAAESALSREVARLEGDLLTIDSELARRDLGPLVASPVRALSEPSLMTVSAHRAGLTGLAGGLMLGIPIAALLAYRVRKRQLWLG